MMESKTTVFGLVSGVAIESIALHCEAFGTCIW